MSATGAVRSSSGTGFGFSEGFGHGGRVCFYGGTDDLERPLSLAHAIAALTDKAREVQFEPEPVFWNGTDANRGAGVLRDVCPAQVVESAHHTLFYAFSEGPS